MENSPNHTYIIKQPGIYKYGENLFGNIIIGANDVRIYPHPKKYILRPYIEKGTPYIPTPITDYKEFPNLKEIYSKSESSREILKLITTPL